MSDTPIRVLVNLSDTHCGSTYGLLPPDSYGIDGNEIRLNAIQRWLWDCWTDCTKGWLIDLVGDDPFGLVVNGDATEGDHHGTYEIISRDTGDHVSAAFEVLLPLAKRAAKVFVIEGTGCHVGNTEHQLARDLNAVRPPDAPEQSRIWAFGRLSLNIAGTRSVFFHHISTTGRAWLEASALSIYLANEQLEAVRNGEPMPQVMSCAHRHRYGEFKEATGLAIVTPPWQMLTRHGRAKVPSARTRPGIAVLDWRKRADGELPDTHVKTYRLPFAGGVSI